MDSIVLKPFFHAEGYAVDVPACPKFYAANFGMIVENDSGRITLQAVGRGPTLEGLRGFFMVVTRRGNVFSFGLAHPKWVNGDMAPFCELFQVPASADLAGLCQNMGYIDLCLASDRGAADVDHFYTFTFISWAEMMDPPEWRKRIMGEKEGSVPVF